MFACNIYQVCDNIMLLNFVVNVLWACRSITGYVSVGRVIAKREDEIFPY